MSIRHLTVALALGVILCAALSCEYPPGTVSYAEPLPQVEYGSSPNDVLTVLGPPKNQAVGYWRDENVFDMAALVWYYPGVGRVMFHDGQVFRTEADATEPGHPQ
jgi:hypothetical protein